MLNYKVCRLGSNECDQEVVIGVTKHYLEQICLLQDILENEDVKLDHMFIASLVADIVKVCLVNGNFKDSLRYIQLDLAP